MAPPSQLKLLDQKQLESVIDFVRSSYILISSVESLE